MYTDMAVRLLMPFLISSPIIFVGSAKLRSWLGPDYFVEGVSPGLRGGHGFIATNDKKLYIFGGEGATGNDTWMHL
jgi:hypothetical protein